MRSLFQSTAVAAALFGSAAIAQTPSTAPAPMTPPTTSTTPSTATTPSATMSQAPASTTTTTQAGGASATAAVPGASPTPTQGASVYGPQGNLVGTIEAVDSQYATLATPNSKVKLPLNSFAARDNGFAIGMTQAQIDAAAGPAGASAASSSAQAGAAQPQSGADAAAAPQSGSMPPSGSTSPSGAAPSGTPPRLTEGAAVSDTKGGRVGTIESVEGEFATVATAKNKVRLPVSAFADAGNGPVIGMTEAELDAAADAAKPKTAAK